jgi:glyoxylase-like metal-dependent hydrolase (beta-lactamase superfamily II)
VDTGIPGQLELIRKTLAEESLTFEKLTKIIITHQDQDHIDSLPELVAASEGRLEVLSHVLAKSYILGEVPLTVSAILLNQNKKAFLEFESTRKAF